MARRAMVVSLLLLALAALTTPSHAKAGFAFSRIAGPDRTATARLIAESTFTSASTVLLARSDQFPDALGGAYLAGVLTAPILLTQSGVLSAAAKQAMTTLKTREVILLGGTSAISKTVEDELQRTPSSASSSANLEVSRIGGKDRYETAQLVAERRGAAVVGRVAGKKTALVARGDSFADALTGGPMAYSQLLPLLLTERDKLTKDAKDAMKKLAIEHVIVLGGTSAVSAGVEADIRDQGITTQRLAGGDRTATASAIADFEQTFLGYANTGVNLARGDAFPDGLTGAPHAGEELHPILLTASPTTLGGATAAWLRSRCTSIGAGTLFGGTSAISQSVENEANAAGRSCG